MAKVVSVKELPEEVEQALQAGEDVTVTRDGKAIARLVPVERILRGSLVGSVKIHGDIVAPIEDEWDVRE